MSVATRTLGRKAQGQVRDGGRSLSARPSVRPPMGGEAPPAKRKRGYPVSQLFAKQNPDRGEPLGEERRDAG